MKAAIEEMRQELAKNTPIFPSKVTEKLCICILTQSLQIV